LTIDIDNHLQKHLSHYIPNQIHLNDLTNVYRRRKTVIITSHDLSEIEKCADDVSMIKNGRLLFDKGIQEMQGQSLEEIFIKEGNRHE
jgi:ABC-type multidrug transport system ATPase subunit